MTEGPPEVGVDPGTGQGPAEASRAPSSAGWPTRLRHPPLGPCGSPLPEVVGIQITGRCPLRCRHCFNHSGPENRMELPLPVLERILRECAGWGLREVRISGGEPTSHRQFREVVGLCTELGIDMSLNTSGIFPAKLLDFLCGAGPISLFLVSVDGDEAQHDWMRGPGTFRRAREVIRRLVEAGRRVLISCHVGAGSAGDIAGLVELAAALGTDIKFSPIRPLGRARENLSPEDLRAEVYLGVVRSIVGLRKRFPATRILTDFDLFGGVAADSCEEEVAAASCKAGRTLVSVNYDGRIYPCVFFATAEGEFSAGSVYTTTLTEAWAASPVFEPFRSHRKSDECLGCGFYQRRCVGGCPAVAHFRTGFLDAFDPTCFAPLLRERGEARR